MSAVRVLLIDDHLIPRAGLRLLLESQPGLVVVGEAGHRADALEHTTREQPDIILLALPLGEDNALDFMPDLFAAAHQARVIVLSRLNDRELHRHSVTRGAMGVVAMQQAPEALFKAIECVHAGQVWVERSILASVLNEMWHPAPGGNAAARIATLTQREREVITLVAQGLKNKQIAERLYVTESTVRNHLAAIFTKLGVSDRLGLGIYAHQHGLLK